MTLVAYLFDGVELIPVPNANVTGGLFNDTGLPSLTRKRDCFTLSTGVSLIGFSSERGIRISQLTSPAIYIFAPQSERVSVWPLLAAGVEARCRPFCKRGSLHHRSARLSLT